MNRSACHVCRVEDGNMAHGKSFRYNLVPCVPCVSPIRVGYGSRTREWVRAWRGAWGTRGGAVLFWGKFEKSIFTWHTPHLLAHTPSSFSCKSLQNRSTAKMARFEVAT